LSFWFQIYFVFPFQIPHNSSIQYRPHLIFQVYSESEAADTQVTGRFDELFIKKKKEKNGSGRFIVP